MRPEAVFAATYADVRLVKTRGVVQFIFEVDLSKARQAFQMLGEFPDPAKELWVAIALLNHEGGAPGPSTLAAELNSSAPESPRGEPSPSKRLVQQVGIACNAPHFCNYIQKSYMSKFPKSADDVESRSEIIAGTRAGEVWQKLYGEFLVWKAE